MAYRGIGILVATLVASGCDTSPAPLSLPDADYAVGFILVVDAQGNIVDESGPFFAANSGPFEIEVPNDTSAKLAVVGWSEGDLRDVDEQVDVGRIGEARLGDGVVCPDGEVSDDGAARTVEIAAPERRSFVRRDGAWRAETLGIAISGILPRAESGCGRGDASLEPFVPMAFRDMNIRVGGQPLPVDEGSLEPFYFVRFVTPYDESAVLASTRKLLIRLNQGEAWSGDEDSVRTGAQLWTGTSSGAADYSVEIAWHGVYSADGTELLAALYDQTGAGRLVRLRYPRAGPPEILGVRELPGRPTRVVAVPDGPLVAVVCPPDACPVERYFGLADFDAPLVELRSEEGTLAGVTRSGVSGQPFWLNSFDRLYRVFLDGADWRVLPTEAVPEPQQFISGVVDIGAQVLVATDVGSVYLFDRMFNREKRSVWISDAAKICAVSHRTECGRSLLSSRTRSLALDAAGRVHMIIDDCPAVLEFAVDRRCDAFAARVDETSAGELAEPRSVAFLGDRVYVGGLGNVFVRTPGP